jgi:hypothetical protein
MDAPWTRPWAGGVQRAVSMVSGGGMPPPLRARVGKHRLGCSMDWCLSLVHAAMLPRPTVVLVAHQWPSPAAWAWQQIGAAAHAGRRPGSCSMGGGGGGKGRGAGAPVPPPPPTPRPARRAPTSATGASGANTLYQLQGRPSPRGLHTKRSCSRLPFQHNFAAPGSLTPFLHRSGTLCGVALHAVHPQATSLFTVRGGPPIAGPGSGLAACSGAAK